MLIASTITRSQAQSLVDSYPWPENTRPTVNLRVCGPAAYKFQFARGNRVVLAVAYSPEAALAAAWNKWVDETGANPGRPRTSN